MDNELRVTGGTTATISYDCNFADGTKKTVTIGSYRTADISNDLATNIKTFNATPNAEFVENFVSAGSGAQFTNFSGCTVTITQRTILI